MNSAVKKWELFTSEDIHSSREMVQFVKAWFPDLYKYARARAATDRNDSVASELIGICHDNYYDDELYTYTGLVNHIIKNEDMISFWIL